jgi:hypothetical protein
MRSETNCTPGAVPEAGATKDILACLQDAIVSEPVRGVSLADSLYPRHSIIPPGMSRWLYHVRKWYCVDAATDALTPACSIMPTKYERPIGDYCARHGIAVPPGFARHTPSRYVIIRKHLTPPKLIAKSWFKTADVIYYIEHFLLPELGDGLSQSIRVLDFQDGEELSYTGGKQLAKIGTFCVSCQSEPG